MRFLVLILAVVCFGASNISSTENTECSQNIVQKFAKSFNQFCLKSYKAASKLYKNSFVISQYTTYLELAAVAEGATGDVRNEIFEVLQLPEDACSRQKYYEFLVNSDDGRLTPDFIFISNRVFAIDNKFTLNETWVNEVENTGLLLPISLPLKSDPEKAKKMLPSNFLRTKGLKLHGDSMIMESVYFRNLWKMAFPDGIVEKNVPFYGVDGKQVSTIDMLHMRKRVQMAYVPSYKAKFLEYKLGEEGRYSLIMVLNEDSNNIADVIGALTVENVIEAFQLIEEGSDVVDVSLPCFKFINEQHDKRPILEEIGVKKLWSDGESWKSISTPKAIPSAYIQSIAIDIDGTGPVSEEKYPELPAVESIFAEDKTFVANRPFMYAVIENNLRIILIGGVYSGGQ